MGKKVKNEEISSVDKIKKVLFNEVTFLIAICSMVIGICLFITGADADMKRDIAVIQTEIQTIKENDLVHLREAISDLDVKIEKMDDKIDKIILEMK